MFHYWGPTRQSVTSGLGEQCDCDRVAGVWLSLGLMTQKKTKKSEGCLIKLSPRLCKRSLNFFRNSLYCIAYILYVSYFNVQIYFTILAGRCPTISVPPIFADDLVKESRGRREVGREMQSNIWSHQAQTLLKISSYGEGCRVCRTWQKYVGL